MDQPFSGPLRFGILSTHPPTACGLATFSAALAKGFADNDVDVSVVRVADGTPPSSAAVVGELVADSPASVYAASELLNQSDVAIIQHEYGIYGGVDGDDVVDVIGGLRVPSIVIAHTVLKDPTAHQRSVLEEVTAAADRVVVMSEAASQRLGTRFNVDRSQDRDHPARRDPPKGCRVEVQPAGRPC